LNEIFRSDQRKKVTLTCQSTTNIAVLLLDEIPHQELIDLMGNAPDRLMLDIMSVGPDVTAAS
jgi:hypothetical protein